MAKNVSVSNSTNTNDIGHSNIKTFADKYWEYGNLWSKEIKTSSNSFPTPEEMLLGLYKWLCDQLNDSVRHLKEKDKKIALRNQFKKFKLLIDEI